ncbi:hypothetical protein [Martelella sp. HB161492]|uniref:hypothetical protein n=1 Tax=Martelella sp. HB161492 TaxID=2720726 RepID=UPI001591E8E7|nr:hypothetical protein [Martelella sp. HB161492]
MTAKFPPRWSERWPFPSVLRAGRGLIGYRLSPNTATDWPEDDAATIVGYPAAAFSATSYALDAASGMDWPEADSDRLVGVVVPYFS